jgi:hypothetical protein
MCCTTIDATTHIILTKEHFAFLHLNYIENTTPWYNCWFNANSHHEFGGTFFLDGVKYDNILGELYYDNHSRTFHYDVYHKNYSDLATFDTKFSLIDAQKVVFSYDSIDIFLNQQ